MCSPRTLASSPLFRRFHKGSFGGRSICVLVELFDLMMSVTSCGIVSCPLVTAEFRSATPMLLFFSAPSETGLRLSQVNGIVRSSNVLGLNQVALIRKEIDLQMWISVLAMYQQLGCDSRDVQVGILDVREGGDGMMREPAHVLAGVPVVEGLTPVVDAETLLSALVQGSDVLVHGIHGLQDFSVELTELTQTDGI
ncbi:hypothetical protein TNIN_443671 [Trichonephila inaurata madagascariensis]|uniref:Uncharacterized protein n=1 Tax=Trichonephila inaurata madagascariensis TaxID=2747483 RepID=A0A8X6M652_9ARAC|nr:hypothetical protein TNIN_443671 [Trichonephila inaurata madagascariensis]